MAVERALIYSARKVMAFARNPSKLVTMLYEELSRLNTRLVETEVEKKVIRIPADTGATSTWEVALGHVQMNGKISKAIVIPDSDIGQANDYMTISLVNKGSDGTGTTVLGSKAVNSSNVFKAFVGKNLIVTPPVVDTAHFLSLKKEVSGDGQAWPGGVIEFTYLPN